MSHGYLSDSLDCVKHINFYKEIFNNHREYIDFNGWDDCWLHYWEKIFKKSRLSHWLGLKLCYQIPIFLLLFF